MSIGLPPPIPSTRSGWNSRQSASPVRRSATSGLAAKSLHRCTRATVANPGRIRAAPDASNERRPHTSSTRWARYCRTTSGTRSITPIPYRARHLLMSRPGRP